MNSYKLLILFLFISACSLKDPTNSRVLTGKSLNTIQGGQATGGKDPNDCPPGTNCIEANKGCMHPMGKDFSQAFNYPAACVFELCLNPAYREGVFFGEVLYYRSQYGGTITHKPELCITPVGDCKDNNCFNLPFQPAQEIKGCLHPLAFNFNPEANTPDECIFKICETTEIREYINQFGGSIDVNPADCNTVSPAPPAPVGTSGPGQ
jgi:hypothetical protein